MMCLLLVNIILALQIPTIVSSPIRRITYPMSDPSTEIAFSGFFYYTLHTMTEPHIISMTSIEEGKYCNDPNIMFYFEG